jgi:hypothetical protein
MSECENGEVGFQLPKQHHVHHVKQKTRRIQRFEIIGIKLIHVEMYFHTVMTYTNFGHGMMGPLEIYKGPKYFLCSISMRWLLVLLVNDFGMKMV